MAATFLVDTPVFDHYAGIDTTTLLIERLGLFAAYLRPKVCVLESSASILFRAVAVFCFRYFFFLVAFLVCFFLPPPGARLS